MKKTLILIAALSALVLSAPVNVFYQGFSNGSAYGSQTPALAKEGGSIFLMDVLLDTSGIVTTRPIDLLNVPYIWRGDTAGVALGANFLAGSMELSCYDNSDSAAVADTVDAVAKIYKSQYAGDNIDPNGVGGGKSDVWTLIDSLPLNDVSAAQAILDTGKTITLTNERDRYLRATITNRQTVLKDKPRCRLYWTKKPIHR